MDLDVPYFFKPHSNSTNGSIKCSTIILENKQILTRSNNIYIVE